MKSLTAAAVGLIAATGAAAQIVPSLPGVPALPGAIDRLGGLVDRTVDGVRTLPPRALAAARIERIADLVRTSGGRIALDDQGLPARAGEVVLTDPTEAQIATLVAQGFHLIAREQVGDLGVGYARFAVPAGARLDRVLSTTRALVPGVAADTLSFQAGASGAAASPISQAGAAGGATIGMIDGGVGPAVAGVRQMGFADGAPRASDHGTAVASLIAGGGRVKGAAPGAHILAADVYGSDPAGGSAVGIARAIGWLAKERVATVAISLVGPAHPLVARTVAAAQTRGMILVAAVGNDGPAAPPAYPASYPGVVAVTAVDGRGRVLLESGRASHLDYAAPGADMIALDARGRARTVRGTSYAVPLVAGSIARMRTAGDWRGALETTAKRGRGYGRGLVCADCATRRF
ncbi:MAG TPA: S8 family serine peptidase [Sphingomonas sp.]|nr:S8 family serine peptidase [Sphingomonas sp.]